MAVVLINGNGFDLHCDNSCIHTQALDLTWYIHTCRKGKHHCESSFLIVGLNHLSTLNVNELLVFCEYSCKYQMRIAPSAPPPPPQQDYGNANCAPEIDL